MLDQSNPCRSGFAQGAGSLGLTMKMVGLLSGSSIVNQLAESRGVVYALARGLHHYTG
jgi:hypothetical protein